MNIKENIKLIKDKYLTKSNSYDCKYYNSSRVDKELDYEFEIDEEIEKYLKELGIQYEIKNISGERSCSYDNNYLFVAWINTEGKLETDFTLLESM